ncbi:hypothetical protein Pmani_029599 [Petrolisthes manimaculis]|uniref:Uncharacterized protein n=1 Tax=Petrolisthes manimaculis TaxID=1843537 RepID=A0AAE1NZ27_9EUCA|nr:hypothetical protein Pmani_029599 [Petrolisthes manimaculis]
MFGGGVGVAGCVRDQSEGRDASIPRPPTPTTTTLPPLSCLPSSSSPLILPSLSSLFLPLTPCLPSSFPSPLSPFFLPLTPYLPSSFLPLTPLFPVSPLPSLPISPPCLPSSLHHKTSWIIWSRLYVSIPREAVKGAAVCVSRFIT